MRTFVTSLLSLSLLLAASATAFAQDRPAREVTPETEFTFGDELVEGDLVVPEGARVWLRGGAVRHSLIHPRAHYVPEMLKSVENL